MVLFDRKSIFSIYDKHFTYDKNVHITIITLYFIEELVVLRKVLLPFVL